MKIQVGVALELRVVSQSPSNLTDKKAGVGLYTLTSRRVAGPLTISIATRHCEPPSRSRI